MSKEARMRLLSPNGHLGFAPLKVESFQRGLDASPDVVAADSGSCDIGPTPLGMDVSTSPQEWQRHDLAHMLLGARKLGVPMLIGSAGDSGSNSRVDLYVRLIQEIAEENRLPKFKVGYFYSELSIDDIRSRLRANGGIAGLDGRSALADSDLDATDRIVAVAGIHPFNALLDRGADVVIGGRCGDAALFAAPAIHAGFPEANAYCLGKILECASFCAEPYAGKETVLGEITARSISVTAMHPDQRCTVASVAGHAMYERSSPYFEYVLGGMLDMGSCEYEQITDRSCQITGARFIAHDPLTVKLEGAGKLGERYIGFAAIRDPNTVDGIDQVITWARSQVEERFGADGYELHYHIYGRNGVMGELEPHQHSSHELGILVEAVAADGDVAREVCTIGTRQMFYARLPGLLGTAGAVAFPLDEVLPARPAYQWTVNHVLTVEDPLEFFPLSLLDAGV